MFLIMKVIKYTRHARNRMRWRRITEEEIASAITTPDFSEKTCNDVTNAWKRLSDKFLKITYKEETETILIITAVKKKKGWR